MHARTSAPGPPQASSFDNRIVLSGVSWSEFEVFLAIKGDRSVPRVTYLEGTLELMSPSLDHETIKSTIGRLLEAWSIERDVPLIAAGSWTLRSAPRERGVEPDECYIVGRNRKERPDLAIEVIWTSGGIDKLEVYRGLEVPEVWLWENHEIAVYLLVGQQYQQVPRTRLFPELDLQLVARLAAWRDQHAAVREFLAAVRGG